MPGAVIALGTPGTAAGTGATPPWKHLRRNRSGLMGLAIVAIFLLLGLLAWAGLLGQGWSVMTADQWAPASATHWFGTNRLGQDILDRAVYSTGTAFQVGLLVATLATLGGATAGSLSGWYRDSVPDHLLLWVMGVMDSIPFYLFAAALAFALQGSPWAMQAAMVATFWTTTGRLVRGEVIRLREREFVESARAIGLPDMTILVRHVLPNTAHILLVQATLTWVAAVKTEVILSFLGLGVHDGVSWGLMLSESTQDVLAGHFGNLIAASGFLFVLLMGFNLLADAMQDALDVREVVA